MADRTSQILALATGAFMAATGALYTQVTGTLGTTADKLAEVAETVAGIDRMTTGFRDRINRLENWRLNQ